MSDKSSRMEDRRNELLADLVDVTTRVLVDEEVSSEVAELAANAVADRLADHWGGQIISFPKDMRRRLAKLELEIFTAWSQGGISYGALALKYKMSERNIRRLIARVRAKIVHDQQEGLFEPPGGVR